MKINNEKAILWAIYASLMTWALGLFISISFLALTHIFIIIPALIFISKTNFKNWPKSSWALLAMIVAIILSVLVNQDIAIEGYKSLTKSKYYLISLLSITPYSYYLIKIKDTAEYNKKITWLLWAIIGTTTLATISGLSGYFFSYNFFLMKAGYVSRNQGLAGMLMNYAHNLAFFMTILTGMILYRDEIKRFVNPKILYGAWIINFIGLYTTYTRGAMLAFLVSLPFFFFKKNKKKFILVTISLALIGIGAYKFAGESVIRPDSEIERLSQWKAAWAGFKERPVFGLGYLNFEKMSIGLKKKYHIEAEYFGGHAHSNYFEMLASSGAIGFIFFVLWHGYWFWEMYKRDDLIARIALPFVIVFIVGGLTQATFTLGANLFFIMPIYAITQIYYCSLKGGK